MPDTSLPPPPPGSAVEPPTNDQPSRWPIPELSAPGWLAATGSALLLIASIVVVSSRWETITPEVRFSGLVAALCAIYFAAESGRHRFRATSTALATLAAAMTAPVAIAAAASIEQTWPVCVLTGGLTAVVAAELQSRRWQVPTLKAATVVATGLTVVGLAALIDVPVGLLGAGAAVAALLLGAWRRGVALGIVVGITPVVAALFDQLGIGRGTLAEIGATGDTLAWSAPLSALIAALVIGVSAQRRGNVTLAVAATSTLSTGVLIGLGVGEIDAIAWWCLPAMILMVVELVDHLAPRSIWSAVATSFRPVILVPVAFGGLVAPVIAGLGVIVADIGSDVADPRWAIPCAFTAGALALATASIAHRSNRPSTFTGRFTGTFTGAFALAFAATAGATLGGVIIATPRSSWPEIGALAAIAAATAVVSRTRHDAWGHAAAVQFIVVAGWSLALADVGVDAATLLLMALATTLTGLGFLRAEVTPVDTAALTAGVLTVLVGLSGSPAVVSLAFVTLSGQLLMYLLARQQFTPAAVAASVLTSSMISLWWTTGTNDVVLTQIRPYGADGTDLALAMSTVALLCTGALMRRMQPVSSWLAYSPGLGMSAAWLLAAQSDTNAAWATVGALALGVIAIGVGGFRRLGAPLVIGTAIVAGTVLISAGPRLAEAPTWIWIAAGGIGLLTLAAVIEQSDRPLISTNRATSEMSLVEQFCRDFD